MKTIIKLLIQLLVLSIFFPFVKVSVAQDDHTVHETVISGINSDVRIVRDNWGVPTILAEDNHDLFFGAGYAMAQDRLWQMDGSRRLARGRVAEISGSGQLHWDIYHRKLGLGQIAENSVELLDETTREYLQAFADGVNSFIHNNPNNLGFEFGLLGYKPDPWEISDSISIMQLVGSWLASDRFEEEMSGDLREVLGEESADELFPPMPREEPGLIASGDENLLIENRRENIAADLTLKDPGITPDSLIDNMLEPVAEMSYSGKMEASNIWAVDGSLTESGEPIIAMDPHLNYFAPSILYEFVLDGGSFNCWGLTFPGMPVMPFGANEDIAWGASNFPADTQDLYELDINPENDRQYNIGSDWYDMEIISDSIPYRDSSGEMRYYLLNTKQTLFGPILEDGSSTATALRATSNDPWDNVTPFFNAMLSVSVEDFYESFRWYSYPAQNYICAESGPDGSIAQVLAGRIPIRDGYDGRYPVKASDGNIDWTGFIDYDSLPHHIDPDSGYLAHANNLPSGGIVDGDYPLGYSFSTNFRVERIMQLIECCPPLTPEYIAAMQMDVYDIPSHLFIKSILESWDMIGDEYPDIAEFAELFRGWNGELSEDSVAATIYQLWLIAMGESCFTDNMPWQVSGYLNYQDRWIGLLEDYVRGESTIDWLSGDDEVVRARRILDQLSNSISFLRNNAGEDVAEWKWGNQHLAIFPHPSGMTAFIGGGEHPWGGGRFTIRVGHFPLSDSLPFTNDFGAVFRSVISSENGTWHIGAVLPPGEGGNMLSPHFRDQIDLWLNGKLRDADYGITDNETSIEYILTNGG